MHSSTFTWVGETLRRVRKEKGKTLSELAAVAKVGKGQLSRIETGKQEITLGTLAKVLSAYGLSRQEFFRRYDLVETGELGRSREAPRSSPSAQSTLPTDPLRWTERMRESIGRIETFLANAAQDARPLAQGGFEAGEYVVLFRVLPRAAVGAEEGIPPDAPEEPK